MVRDPVFSSYNIGVQVEGFRPCQGEKDAKPWFPNGGFSGLFTVDAFFEQVDHLVSALLMIGQGRKPVAANRLLSCRGLSSALRRSQKALLQL